MTDPILAAVVAVAKNGVIGRDGDLPWRIPSDLKRFKETTLGKPVLMGRKTWESLPKKPLPGRANFVISATLPGAEGAQVYADANEALAAATREAQRAGVEEVCLIGGARLYGALLARTQRLYLTEVDLNPDGDARFPALDPGEWREVSAERVEAGPRDDAGFIVRVLERVGTA